MHTRACIRQVSLLPSGDESVIDDLLHLPVFPSSFLCFFTVILVD